MGKRLIIIWNWNGLHRCLKNLLVTREHCSAPVMDTVGYVARLETVGLLTKDVLCRLPCAWDDNAGSGHRTS